MSNMLAATATALMLLAPTPVPSDAPASETLACSTGGPVYVTVATPSDASVVAHVGDVVCVDEATAGATEWSVVGGGSIESMRAFALPESWPADIDWDDAGHVTAAAGLAIADGPDRTTATVIRDTFADERMRARVDLTLSNGVVPVRGADGAVGFVTAGALAPTDAPQDDACALPVMALHSMSLRTETGTGGSYVQAGDVLCALGQDSTINRWIFDSGYLDHGEAVQLPDGYTGEFAYDTARVVIDAPVSLGAAGALSNEYSGKLSRVPSEGGVLSGGSNTVRDLTPGETIYIDEHTQVVGSVGLAAETTWVPARTTDGETGWVTLAALGKPGSYVTPEPSPSPTATADTDAGMLDKAKDKAAGWWAALTGGGDDQTSSSGLIARTTALPALVASLVLSLVGVVLAAIGGSRRKPAHIALRLLHPVAAPLALIATVTAAAVAPAAYSWTAWIAAAAAVLSAAGAFGWGARLAGVDKRWAPLEKPALITHVKQPRTWRMAFVTLPVALIAVLVTTPGALASVIAFGGALAAALGYAARTDIDDETQEDGGTDEVA